MEKVFSQFYQEHDGKLTDKWSLYIAEWDRIFSPYQDEHIDILEIGIQNGGSLEIWSKYFQKAGHIVGCDIDTKCGNFRYDDERISVVIGDANTAECEEVIQKVSPTYDIIIDDGSHRSCDVISSFARYFPRLKNGGIYLIEDLHTSYWADYGGGMHSPLSSMSFLKRLADILNYEHWRNNRTRASFLSSFSSQLGLSFDEMELMKMHSIEFINSLCVIKKAAPELNRLGKRKVAGTEESVTSGFARLNGTEVLDMPADIADDANLDVFALIGETKSLRGVIEKQDQDLHYQSAQLADKDQYLASRLAEQDQYFASHLAEKDEFYTARMAEVNQYAKTLEAQGTEKDQVIQTLFSSISEKDAYIQTLFSSISEKDAFIQTIQQSVTDKNQALQSMAARVDRQVAEAQELKKNMEACEQEKIALSKEIEQNRAAITGYLSSASWRITKPLRDISALIRKIF